MYHLLTNVPPLPAFVPTPRVPIQQYNPAVTDATVAVVEKASWPEERVVKGRLQELADMVTEAGIKKTALILVGEFLSKSGKSKLYDKDFSHEYR